MMLTGSRFWTLALVVGLCALGTAGCKRKSSGGDTVVNGSDIFTTDEFPGASVQNGNIADDQRAMSVSGSDVTPFSVRRVANGDRGTSIVTYLTTSGRLYAHYFDGESWTPPVALSALDCNLTTATANTEVAFINTDDSSSDFAQDRNGDALIFWIAQDGASSTAGDDANTNLWVTYFDVSHAGDIAFNYGFQAEGSRVSTLEDSNASTFGDEAVSMYGLISDGLCGEARWFSGGCKYAWGNETTDSIIVFWRQAQDNDGSNAAFDVDQYIATARFDLNAAIDAEIPLVPGVNNRLAVAGFGASDSGTSSEETQIGSSFITYNNDLFYVISSHATAGSGTAGVYNPALVTGYEALTANDDVNIQVVAFNLSTGTQSAAATLLEANPSSVSGDTFQCSQIFPNGNAGFSGGPAITFGSDEGLAELDIYTFELANDPDTTFGGVSPQSDARVRLTQIDEATGAILAGLNIDVDDSDTTGTPVADLGGTRFWPRDNSFEARISRNGDYIFATWFQGIDAAPTGNGVEDYRALWVSEHITTRIADDGTFPVLPAIASSTSIAVNTEAVVSNFRVLTLAWQDSLGYICGVQSDPDVMNLLSEHSDLTGDTLWVTRCVADLDPAGGAVPVFTTTALESFQEGDHFLGQFDNSIARNGSNLTDSGEGGNVFASYRKDIDFLAPVDNRLFAEKTGVGGGQVEIDSSTSDKQVGGLGGGSVIRLATTPPGSEIGVFDLVDLNDDDQRYNPAHFVHVLFFETRFSEVDGLPFALRTRVFNSEDTSITFGDTFTPNAGTTFTDPFQLDLPGIAPSSGTFDPTAIQGIGVNGDTVGLYFTEGSRIYYQEANPGDSNDGTVWRNNDGVSNPVLVDDDNDEEIQTFENFSPRACTCDTLTGSMVFWTKAFGSGSGGGFSQRLQVRVRE